MREVIKKILQALLAVSLIVLVYLYVRYESFSYTYSYVSGKISLFPVGEEAKNYLLDANYEYIKSEPVGFWGARRTYLIYRAYWPDGTEMRLASCYVSHDSEDTVCLDETSEDWRDWKEWRVVVLEKYNDY